MNTDPTYPTDLITSYFAGEASGDDLTFLAEWLKADPKHRKFFEFSRKTWNSLEKARIESQTDLDLEWHDLEKKIIFSSPSKVQTLPGYSETSGFNRIFTARAFRIAAIFLLLAVPAGFLYNYIANPKIKKLSAEIAMVEEKLPDGTSVTLNAGSSIQYPTRFKGHERDVKLTGEAYFEVTHDKTKPFIISASNIRVEVLGTSFYVNTHASNGKMQVILTSGQVAIYYEDNTSEKVILAPGEKADISFDQHGIVKAENEDPDYFSFKSKRLIFNNDPLVEIVDRLRNVYQAQIRITNPALSHCLITATFDNQSLQSVLHVLGATLNVKITQNGTWTEISGNGCN